MKRNNLIKAIISLSLIVIIRAIIYTLNDNLREMQDRLEMVCFDLYLPEETKDIMVKEREEIGKFFEQMNAQIAEENKARGERHPCDN